MSEVGHRIRELRALFIMLTALRTVEAAEVYFSSHQVGLLRRAQPANLFSS